MGTCPNRPRMEIYNEKERSIMNNYGRKINFMQLRYDQFKCKINAHNSGPNENKKWQVGKVIKVSH